MRARRDIPVAACLLLLFAAPGAWALPDGRAYEQVTPVDKNGGDVGGPAFAASYQSAHGQASADGNAITYLSVQSFGDAQGAELVTQYTSTRGEGGWSTHAISPPGASTRGLESESTPFPFFTPDLSAGFLEWPEPALSEEAPPGFENIYLRDAGGAYRVITTVGPPNRSTSSYEVTFAGASSDLGHVAFEANDALTAEAPPNARSVYEWTRSGLRLVSVMPGGAAAASAGAGDGSDGDFANVVSSDGSRVFWTDDAGQLYVREEGTRTVKLNASRRAVSLGDGTAVLRAATPAGSKAIFSDATPLTDAPDDSGGLYEYDLESEALRNLTPSTGGAPGVQGVLGMADDGSTVYFVAGAALTGGAVVGAMNLYVARDGGVELVAVLSGDDSGDWTTSTEARTARLTPDGEHLAFLSTASLTGYDNTDAVTGALDRELFSYDAGEGRLTCVSCNPSGARPLGGASIPPGTNPGHAPRIVSDDGDRVLFSSRDALVAADGDGGQDVYEFEDGEPRLISSGSSGDLSALVDMSPSGRDVFFATRARLVATDRDNGSDVYDARIGGGFPLPREALPCAAEACRGPLSAPPAAVPPAATSLPGGRDRAARARGRCRHRSAKAKRSGRPRRCKGRGRG